MNGWRLSRSTRERLRLASSNGSLRETYYTNGINLLFKDTTKAGETWKLNERICGLGVIDTGIVTLREAGIWANGFSAGIWKLHCHRNP